MGGDEVLDGMFREVLGDDRMDEIHRNAVEQTRRDVVWAACAVVPVAAAFTAVLWVDAGVWSLAYFATALAVLWLMTRLPTP